MGDERNRRLAKHVADASLGGFLLKLGYKADMYGAKVIATDRWFPSSRICSSYGAVKSELRLGERVAGCPPMDGDLNAATRLRDYAAASCVEMQNGCGESVSPPAVSAVLGEASTPTRRTAAAMSLAANLALSGVAD